MIQLAPDISVGYENLGGIYMLLGRYTDALALLKKSIALKASSGALSNLASCYQIQGQYEQAIPLLKQAISLREKDHRLWRNLGDNYAAIGRAADARAAYARAFELARAQADADVRNASILIRAAVYAAKLGDAAEARAYEKKALASPGADGDTEFNAAIVSELLGRRTEALAAIERALSKHYSLKQIETTPELVALRKDSRYTVLNQKLRAASKVNN